MAGTVASVDEYVAGLPEDARAVLDAVRRTIHEAVPGAGETIKYDMPTITLDGRSLVHFAGWKRHVSLYPLPDEDADPGFAARVAPYRSGASTAKFPLDQPVPYDLIAEIATRLRSQRGA